MNYVACHVGLLKLGFVLSDKFKKLRGCIFIRAVVAFPYAARETSCAGKYSKL